MKLPAFMTSRRGTIIALLVMMVAEFLLFDRMTSRHFARIYPQWNDQIQYLRESYTAFAQLKAEGLAYALKFCLTKTALQGTLHDFFAVIVFWIVGSASRSAALSLNMLVFLAWQTMLFYTLWRKTRSATWAWMGFGLLLCVAWPWSGDAGSAVDFRLDHAAMCLMGITACVALLTSGFRHTRWAMLFGFATAITLLERFLTGVYFAAIYFALAAWILCGDDRWRRLRNLTFAGAITAALALPVFWFNRTAIYTYYWVGQVSGAESTARLRGFDFWHSLRFVGDNLAAMHLGVFFGCVVTGLTVILIIAALCSRLPRPKIDRDWLFTALAFAVLPALVLTVHKQKSEYVLGVIVPGVVLLVLWLWRIIWPGPVTGKAMPAARLLPLSLALATLLAGESYFIHRQLATPYQADFLASARQVNLVADCILSQAQAHHISHPNIAVDQVVDFLDAQILQVVCYERHKIWVPFVIQLPDSILADKDEVMLYRVKLCDFVVLTDEMPGNGYWPYDKQMRRLYPQLKSWCDEHLRLITHFSAFGRKMSLYERPSQP